MQVVTIACSTCSGNPASLVIALFVILSTFALGSRGLRWFRAWRERRRKRAAAAAMEVSR